MSAQVLSAVWGDKNQSGIDWYKDWRCAARLNVGIPFDNNSVFFSSPSPLSNKYNTQDNGRTGQYWLKPYCWKKYIFIFISRGHNHGFKMKLFGSKIATLSHYWVCREKRILFPHKWPLRSFKGTKCCNMSLFRHSFSEVTSRQVLLPLWSPLRSSQASASPGGCKQRAKYTAFNHLFLGKQSSKAGPKVFWKNIQRPKWLSSGAEGHRK